MDNEYIEAQRKSTPAVSVSRMLPTLRIGDGLVVQAYDEQQRFAPVMWSCFTAPLSTAQWFTG